MDDFKLISFYVIIFLQLQYLYKFLISSFFVRVFSSVFPVRLTTTSSKHIFTKWANSLRLTLLRLLSYSFACLDSVHVHLSSYPLSGCSPAQLFLFLLVLALIWLAKVEYDLDHFDTLWLKTYEILYLC
jgi:hypothetical protein